MPSSPSKSANTAAKKTPAVSSRPPSNGSSPTKSGPPPAPRSGGGKQHITSGGKTYKAVKKIISNTHRAGLQFPVTRIRNALRKHDGTKRINLTAGIYLAAVLEYCVAEVLELAGNCANDFNRIRITPRHIQLAIHNDDELDRLVGKHVTIMEGGVVPNLHPALLPGCHPAQSPKKKKLAKADLSD